MTSNPIVYQERARANEYSPLWFQKFTPLYTYMLCALNVYQEIG